MVRSSAPGLSQVTREERHIGICLFSAYPYIHWDHVVPPFLALPDFSGAGEVTLGFQTFLPYSLDGRRV